MIKIIIRSRFLAFIYLLHNFTTNGQMTSGYVVDGQIEGLNNNEKIVMLLSYDFPHFERKDSAYVTNGKFHISGFVPEGPRIYWLSFESHYPNKHLLLYIDNNQTITIKSQKNIDSISNFDLPDKYMTVQGSKSNNDYWSIRSASDLYLYSIKRIDDYIANIANSSAVEKNEIAALLMSKDILNYTLVHDIFLRTTNNSSIPCVMNGIHYWGNRSGIFKLVYDSLVAHHENIASNFYGRKLQKAASLCEGQPFPLFSLPSIQGSVLSLKSILSRGEVTLINIWGWNSYNVENNHQELLQMYNAYKSFGLNIVGVYSDTSSNKWKIIASDLPWYHVSDLRGKNGIVETTYGELAGKSTTNILVDKEGKIISWDISGTLLRYYLDKYLKDDSLSKRDNSSK